MKTWYFLLGFVGIIAILGVGFLVLWPTKKESVGAIKLVATVSSQTVNATITPAAETSSAITMTLVGDVMLDRYVRTTINQHSPAWPFEGIQPELLGDVVIGNLEGPFTKNASVATNTHLIFTFDPQHVSGLVSAGFTHFSLANNHTLNFGEVGLASTRTTLAAAGLHSFGDPKNRVGFSLSEKIHGQTITLIGYHGLVSGRENVIEEIKAAKARHEFVMVMPHWGIEYQTTVSSKQVNDAHALIEAGADLVIGAHPHIIQPIEVYQDKMILYSLGNFLFDQYFSDATKRGLLVRFTIDDDVVSAALLPIMIQSGQVKLVPANDSALLLAELAKNSTTPETVRESISAGRLTLPLQP